MSTLINYLKYLQEQVNVPLGAVIFIIVLFIIIQIIGELLEFKGKIVPEFMKIRKRFERKKQERELIAKVSKQLDDNSALFKEMLSHYNTDNISKRDIWMRDVDEDRNHIHTLEEILLKVQQEVVKLRIESMRSEIIAFASRVSNGDYIATREEFNRIFRLYDEYERVLAENGLENGEIDINFHIIKKSYERNLLNHTFLEDMQDTL